MPPRIETLFLMVTFALGWRLITSKGYLFYSIRKPFELIDEEIEAKESIQKLMPYNKYVNNYITLLKFKRFIATPLVLCITCFASIWGASVYIALNGIGITQLPELIILCVSTSFIQTAIWYTYERYIQ
jgi:hypothetical protein